MVAERLFARQVQIIEPRRRIALVVGDQLHQQDALDIQMRLGHAHTRSGQSVQGIDLGVLPNVFLLLAPVARAFCHGARLSAVSHLTPFAVQDLFMKTPLIGLLVDLGATHRAIGMHHIDGGLLAALEWTDHLVDKTVANQRFEPFWDFHRHPDVKGQNPGAIAAAREHVLGSRLTRRPGVPVPRYWSDRHEHARHESIMKPDTRTVMRQLIDQVRAAIPFDTPQARICSGDCSGCSQKLLDYLEGELAAGEQRLADGDRPSLADLSRLAKTARNIHRVLVRNGVLVEEAEPK